MGQIETRLRPHAARETVRADQDTRAELTPRRAHVYVVASNLPALEPAVEAHRRSSLGRRLEQRVRELCASHAQPEAGREATRERAVALDESHAVKRRRAERASIDAEPRGPARPPA